MTHGPIDLIKAHPGEAVVLGVEKYIDDHSILGGKPGREVGRNHDLSGQGTRPRVDGFVLVSGEFPAICPQKFVWAFIGHSTPSLANSTWYRSGADRRIPDLDPVIVMKGAK